jgi:sterol 14alpha-demethylase
VTMTAQQPPVVSGEQDENGHLEEVRTDPIALMQRVRDECGDIGSFRIGAHNVVLLTGAELQEWYFRADDALLDQAAAYPFMTPIFGKGVVFDAPPERRKEMLQNQALRGPQMRGHAETIAREVERAVAPWDGPGEIDLLDWFAELTIYTSSACLVGPRFRESLDGSFARLYHDLERGTDPIAYIDPYAPIESFRKRDAARVALVQLVEAIMDERRAAPAPAEADMLDVLMSLKHDDGTPRFSSDEITGIFISMMFAGHHTTSGTAAWTLIELLRRPDEMAAVVAELDELYADGSSVSFQALREIPRLEAALKEALRLHPPLILLLRVATENIELGGYLIKAGDLVAATPAISNRLPSDFPDANDYVPERYLDPRREDDVNPWTWIPFGGGKHRCVGAAFAMMQLKAIFSVLLRGYTFELLQPSETYRNDHSKMVVQLQQPCRVAYRPREQA